MPKSSKRSKSNTRDPKKKKKSTKEETLVEETIVEDPVVSTENVSTTESAPKKDSVKKESSKKESSKKDSAPKKDSAKKVVDGVGEPAVEGAVDTAVEGGKRQRRVVTKETILDDFEELLRELDQELEVLRTSDVKDMKARKTKGVKFVRSVTKRVKSLRNDANRVMRTRKQSTRPKNTSSGFMKPVQISSEMAKFTGWEPDVPRSRVDVTKYLCQYIRENDLQNPEDRRIIRPDNQLKTLLNLQNVDGEKDPLTYYSLQKSIQHHFTNGAKASA